MPAIEIYYKKKAKRIANLKLCKICQDALANACNQVINFKIVPTNISITLRKANKLDCGTPDIKFSIEISKEVSIGKQKEICHAFIDSPVGRSCLRKKLIHYVKISNLMSPELQIASDGTKNMV